MSLFMRDELHHWRKQFPSPSTMDDKMLKERCLANVHQIMKRTLTVSCKNENVRVSYPHLTLMLMSVPALE